MEEGLLNSDQLTGTFGGKKFEPERGTERVIVTHEDGKQTFETKDTALTMRNGIIHSTLNQQAENQ